MPSAASGVEVSPSGSMTPATPTLVEVEMSRTSDQLAEVPAVVGQVMTTESIGSAPVVGSGLPVPSRAEASHRVSAQVAALVSVVFDVSVPLKVAATFMWWSTSPCRPPATIPQWLRLGKRYVAQPLSSLVRAGSKQRGLQPSTPPSQCPIPKVIAPAPAPIASMRKPPMNALRPVNSDNTMPTPNSATPLSPAA